MREVKQSKGIYACFFKRMLDIIISLSGIIILSPLLIVVAILVRIKLGSPVLFKQPRPGRNEKIFTVYKFRTMTDAKDKNGERLPDSERLVPFGRFLRATSIDELPEMFNILLGDMSIIGPRPLSIVYLPYYNEVEKHRHDVRAGLTGLAQVSGRNALEWDKRFEKDVYYVEHCSFMLDAKIFFETIMKVLKKSDVVVEGASVVEDFSDYRERQWLEESKQLQSKE